MHYHFQWIKLTLFKWHIRYYVWGSPNGPEIYQRHQSRNPIYAAFFIPLAALASLSFMASAIGVITHTVLMEVFVIKPDGAELAQIFGQDFVDWKAKSRRWVNCPLSSSPQSPPQRS
jgi:protein-S-isoprenylcysteine O-methyltransferase Ste14